MKFRVTQTITEQMIFLVEADTEQDALNATSDMDPIREELLADETKAEPISDADFDAEKEE